MALTPAFTAQQLIDLEQIRHLKYTYGARVDALTQTGAAGAELVGEIFTDDAHFDFTSLGGPLLHSRGDIVAFFANAIAPSFNWLWHSFSNPIITFDGDIAKAIWMLRGLGTAVDSPDGPIRPVYGRYYDEYVQTPQGWRQSSFVVKGESPAAIALLV